MKRNLVTQEGCTKPCMVESFCPGAIVTKHGRYYIVAEIRGEKMAINLSSGSWVTATDFIAVSAGAKVVLKVAVTGEGCSE
jgi:hypothetical protein